MNDYSEELSLLVLEARRLIDALVVKSDCSLDRNEEFAAVAAWKNKARHYIDARQAANQARNRRLASASNQIKS